MRANISDRVNKHRASLRAAGLRPIQIWVPDTRLAGFVEECHRQSLLANESDQRDDGLMNFMDEALSDVDSWEA